MLNNFLKARTIAYYTFKEIIKSKILINVLLLGVALFVVTFVAYSFTYGEPSRVALDFGLGMLSLSSVGIAIFIGSGLLSKEIENRTVYMIISRPVPRFTFILGKILGMSGILVLNVLLLSILTLLCYFMIGGVYTPMIGWAILFTVFEAILVLLVVSLLSLITTQTLSVLFSLMIYISGHGINAANITNFVSHRPALQGVLDFYHYVLPGFYKLNVKDLVLYKQDLEWSYILNTFGYSVFYGFFLIILSIFIFEKKNLD